MKELIIGGIYLTPNSNYLVVLKTNTFFNSFGKEQEEYFVAHFHKDFYNQYDLQKLNIVFEYEYEPYFINVKSEYVTYYFNCGYCGKVTENFLAELKEQFNKDYIFVNQYSDLGDKWQHSYNASVI